MEEQKKIRLNIDINFGLMLILGGFILWTSGYALYLGLMTNDLSKTASALSHSGIATIFIGIIYFIFVVVQWQKNWKK